MLGQLARPAPDDRLAAAVDLVGDPVALLDRDSRQDARQRVATWSKVLWLSLRTMTRQSPPCPDSGPALRGRSIVFVDTARMLDEQFHGKV